MFRISVESLFFTEINGKADLMCFKNMASNIINDTRYKKRNKNAEEESNRIFNTGAKIIIPGLRSIDYNISTYLTNSQISDLNENKKWVPNRMDIFLETLIKKPP